MRKWVVLSVLSFSLIGCSDKLETGYKPRPLGASGIERRGFYADQFSPEAREAAAVRGEELQPHRQRTRID